MKCADCDGTGQIWVWIGVQTVQVECGECKGTGKRGKNE